MKDIDAVQIPEDCRYSDDHEWARSEGDLVRVGISDYAQDQLGDIVYVELPDFGAVFEKDEGFGTVESVKSVSDLLIPVGGEVVEVNGALEGSPELVNRSPYDDGWMIVVKPGNPTEMDDLMNADTYMEMLKGSD